MLYEITVLRSGMINEPPVPKNLERVVFYIEAKDAGEAEERVVSMLSDEHLLWEIHRTYVDLSEIEPPIRPEPDHATLEPTPIQKEPPSATHTR